MKAHLVTCTHCAHREIAPDPKNREMELCALTYRRIPRPNQPGRFCENFHQEGHDCPDCFAAALNWSKKNTMVCTLDSGSEI